MKTTSLSATQDKLHKSVPLFIKPAAYQSGVVCPLTFCDLKWQKKCDLEKWSALESEECYLYL